MQRGWLTRVVVGVSLSWACAAPRPAPPQGADASFLARAREHIAAREYRASENGQGLQAPNRAHNLRTYFEKTGIRVHDRTAGSPELLGLTLIGVGRGDDLNPIGPGEVVSAEDAENRVRIRRNGLDEWYRNSPVGLEQGFTIERRPIGEGPLAVEIAVATARISLRGDAIVFDTGSRKLRYGELAAADADGVPMAAHFELEGADRLRIVVDDAGAMYPLIIDPLLTESADAQFEANQTSATLGNSVASAGDVNGDGYADVIVGAPFYDAGQADEGAAFLFRGSASGVASGNPATLGVAQLESNQGGALLGTSVASAGDVNGDGYADLIAGAPRYDNGETDEGAAFIFLGSASGIASGNPSTAATRLESNHVDVQLFLPFVEFGGSVAGAGDVNGDGYGDVIVGATGYENGQTDEGAAFVFLGSVSGIPNSNPTSLGVIALESNQEAAFLGTVASAGDVNADGYGDVIVGAISYNDNPEPGPRLEGAALVYRGSASGIVLAPTVLETNQFNAWLGRSVASAGDVNGDGYGDVIVGAHQYDAGQTDEGAAFVFLGSASGISTGVAAQLEANQSAGGGSDGAALLGTTVAGAGDVNGDGYADVVVGAPGYNAVQTDEGAAFVFIGSASGIANGNPATAYAQLESDQAEAQLGTSAAGAGDVNGDGYADVIVGSSAYDGGGWSDEGAAFVYLGGSSGISDGNPATAAAQIESNQNTPSPLLGNSVAAAGDVNDDGYGDLIVGAPYYDAGQFAEGAAFVFLGSASGIADGSPTTAAAQIESDQSSALLGQSVAGAGDVNGDGYADVIVGAPSYDAGQTDEGAAFVLRGSASGIPNSNPATSGVARLESNQASASLGFSVAGAGDVNGDGYADVIAGASLYDAGSSAEGAAFVFHGGASGIANGNPGTAAAQLESDQTNGQLGWSVAGAGDVNGDGYADVIAGADGYDAGQTDEGAAFVFPGSASGIADSNPATVGVAQLESEQANARLGDSVAGAGDVNGDGYADVIAGARYYDAGETDEGAAFVFPGSASGIADSNPATVGVAQLESDQASAFLGASVAGAGDVNGDSYADVIVGAYLYETNAGQADEGAAFVFLGGATGIADGNPTTAAAQLESDQSGALLGVSVAGAGDVNGDGHADVIAGAVYYDAGLTDEGAAFVFLGNSAGRPVLARQRRGNGSGIAVQPWGLAQSATGFAAELRASHPEGTGRVKAQLQACPPGVPFGHASCTSALTPTWVTVNAATPEVLISHAFTGLSNNTLYRWRARVLHAPATGPLPANPAHGPWRRLGAQSVEADIRLPEPGLLLSLASGAALVAALARRRSRSLR